jgi:hypothetical protein
MTKTVFFNVQHAPIGAFASFTLGCKGARGGLGLELGGPANESVYIGLETRRGGRYEALPFFAGAEDDARRYDVSAAEGSPGSRVVVVPFPDRAIRRRLGVVADTWSAGDLTFTIYSPFLPVPDPDNAPPEALKLALVPAVLAEIVVDNRAGRRDRTVFFGYAGQDPTQKMRRLDDTSGGRFAGVGVGRRTAIVSADRSVRSGLGFGIGDVLAPRQPANLAAALGAVGALFARAPAGRRSVYRFAVCFHRDGTATAGMPSAYLYTRWFERIEDVASYALKHFAAVVRRSRASEKALRLSRLSADQRLNLVHAIHSYYGSTELLEADRPFWVVNEGEYRMMNTFDLAADQVFFEATLNPWTVRNVLEWYVARFSYRDTLRLPGDAAEYPGGLSFAHDMGVANNVSRPGHSAYEQAGLTGCFSHMTHEELVNWILCAAVYVTRTGDRAWFRRHEKVFRDGFASLCRRDHPDPAKRTGVMKLDSSRCQGGAEITTYDSLDASLGQARNNLYLAVKTWAAYVCLAELTAPEGDERAAGAMRAQARRTADTIVSQADADGLLPAILHEGVNSRIIPAVEGLAFPWFCGYRRLLGRRGPYGPLMRALERHLAGVLRPGVCLFPDGAWKLSSTSDNSWLSKIYLCQFVARRVFGWRRDARSRRADAAHAAWLLRPENTYWAWSDQMVKGIARGSKYYPRGVSAILWTAEA